MNFFWVNLGTSFKEVKEYGFLWAPKYATNANGKEVKNAGWESMSKIKSGDVIFGYRNWEVNLILRATSDSYTAGRPDNRKFAAWEVEGWRVDIAYEELTLPIDIREFKEEFIDLYNDYCHPKVFNKRGLCTQIYMSSLSVYAGLYLIDKIDELKLDILLGEVSQKEYERKILAKARIGQGEYRKDLLELWEGKCAVTGVDRKDLLIASHIYPWCLSKNEDKINKFNGLLLSPNLDRLFDKGLISFNDNGSVLIKDTLSDEILCKLGVSNELRIDLIKEGNKKFLKMHRKLYGFK
ncbi:HNH endonuclease [Pectobacterium zantedeschiae]|uniref:HNH endonuclease n=1 Tax=Pectobacterium zantedeschiae TaxID=2034769 RepID=A0A9X8JIT5_9GAMM|nr:HNH endonuclease signature motif containing protein [Pectobacterium zantedeschiae]RYC44630.1 HNH endonuclease [Pectobacterium zantedeschiae]RYC49787.1 HNH endonuclease [Pectobacterium zantedeschiae]